MPFSSLLIRGFHGSRIDIGAEPFAKAFDRGIRLERRCRANDFVLFIERPLPVAVHVEYNHGEKP